MTLLDLHGEVGRVSKDEATWLENARLAFTVNL